MQIWKWFSSTAVAAPLVALLTGPTTADECDALAAEVIARTGAAFDRRSDLAHMVHLKHPNASALSVQCASGAYGAGVGSSWDGAYPPRSFYDLIARAGAAVTKAPAEDIRQGAMKCQQAALKSDDELAEMTFKGIRFECQAFSRDGGGTTITLYKGGPYEQDD